MEQLDLTTFALAQQLVLLPDLLALGIQIDENRDFGTQNFRIEGLEDVIDGASGVALENILLFLADRGEKDDRSVT